MYLRSEDNRLVDSEFSLDQFEGAPCIVVESSGGASLARGITRRNPDYNLLLSTLLKRLAVADIRVTRVVLDSRKVANLPIADRVVDLPAPYPLRLNRLDLEATRKALQREVADMHRDPKAERGGNAQKRIRICLDRPVDVDLLLMGGEVAGDASNDEYSPGLTETERSYLRSARLGQGTFRSDLFKRFRAKCPVTGIENEDLLVASHVKPWKVSTNAERLDPNNGLLVSALVDKLFDKGLVTFLDDGSPVVSQRLSEDDRGRCCIAKWRHLELTDQARSYMTFHRTIQFKSK